MRSVGVDSLRGLAAALLGTVVTTTGLAAESPSDSGAPGVQEVVVTAQRRSENLQTVPLSVTALDNSSIERMGITTLKDLAREVPGLTVVSSGPGQNILIMRGISSTAGTTATVGYYLDDTPIQASSNAALLSARGVVDPALFDLARVEVLRGPQGTLYGSSSMGGTVKYVTTQPDATRFSATVGSQVSYTDGGGPNVETTGTLNMPITDAVAARVSAFYRHNDGFIDRYSINPNNYLGVNAAAGPARNVNSENTSGVRAVVKIDATSNLSITPSVIFQEQRLGGPFNFDSPQGSFDNLIQARDTAEGTSQKTWIGNITVRETLPDFELMSSTSYYDREIMINEDASNVLYFFFSPTPQNFVYPVSMHGDYRNKEWTEEGRLTSTFQGPFQVTGGLFYHYVEAPLSSSIPDTPGYQAAFGDPFGGETIYGGTRNASLREYAVYGEASYDIPDIMKITAGVRGFRVDQTFLQTGEGILNGGSTINGSTSRDTGANPKVTLSHSFTPDDMVYVTASKGYRPGGPNNPAPASVCGPDVEKLGLSQSQLTKYDSDHLWNYEIGGKSRWLDRRLTVNGAVYYIDWSKVQQQIVLGCGFNITANFGKATSKGGELEVSYVPVDGLTFTASGSYTDATLGNAIPGTDAQKGDRLTDVPRWTAAISGEYERTLTGNTSGFARIDFTDRDGANALYDRTSPFYHYDGFGLLNLRIGLETKEAWKASLYLDNAFNKIGETALPVAIAADLPTTRRIAVNTPRTVGVSLQYQF
ncbi:MAG TPA: TonB-dependent receptor [Steroidobacteraceae bacterium]|nr:TonB-dependent receptor [Steroidobacteraceae bacterium]